MATKRRNTYAGTMNRGGHRIHSFWLITTLLLGSSTLASQADASIHWRANVQRAIQEATQTGKPLFVSVSTTWCHYCKKMDDETLANATVAKHIEDCFVPLKIDGDQDRELSQMLGVRSFPTIVVISPKMEVITTMKGYRTASQLHSALESICSSHEAAPQSSRKAFDKGRASNKEHNTSALGEYCPVTSLHSHRLVQSNKRFGLQYRGFDVWFASLEAQKEFQARPDRYWPMLDGHCVVTALNNNQLRQGNWEHGLAYADRIWFFASRQQMKEFAARPKHYLEGLLRTVRQEPPQQQPMR